MQENKTKPATVEDYIAQFPAQVQSILASIRAVIIESAPGAEEKISYGMPGYYLNGGLVWFGAYKRHIGIYPKTAAMLAAIPELSAFNGTKGSLHFRLDSPMPYDLVQKIVAVRIAEIMGSSPA